jgi:multidrug resistance protein MdtO
VMALGATVFLFPHMDSVTSVVVLVAVAAFISAWVAKGAHTQYVGIQIAFSFYVVAFSGLQSPTALAPVRDRIVGILLALVVLWFVFDQLWPVRTVTVMRIGLASLLKSAAEVFALPPVGDAASVAAAQERALRDRVGRQISTLRNLDEVIDYEIGAGRELHAQAGDAIMQAAFTALALIWNQTVHLHDASAEQMNPATAGLQAAVVRDLASWAQAIESRQALPAGELTVVQEQVHGEYVRNTVARYEELRQAVFRVCRESYRAG